MTRRELREHLFRLLFQKDFHHIDELEQQIELYFQMFDITKEEYIEEIITKFDLLIEKLEEVDSIIEEVATGWKLNRLGRVDLNLLRLATYEIRYDEDIPTAVAINEAVEIAKVYGEENSPGFVNGILAKIA